MRGSRTFHRFSSPVSVLQAVHQHVESAAAQTHGCIVSNQVCKVPLRPLVDHPVSTHWGVRRSLPPTKKLRTRQHRPPVQLVCIHSIDDILLLVHGCKIGSEAAKRGPYYQSTWGGRDPYCAMRISSLSVVTDRAPGARAAGAAADDAAHNIGMDRHTAA